MSEKIQKNSKKGWKPYLRAESGSTQPWPKRLSWTVCFWALLAVIAVTLMWGIPSIESRLDGLSRARLQNAGVDTSTLNLRWDYRDLTVYGEHPSHLTAPELEEILHQGETQTGSFFARGIRNIDIQSKPKLADPVVALPEEPSEASVSISMQRGVATLEGVVASSEQHQLLVNALLGSGIENIDDNLDVISEVEPIGGAKVEVLADMLSTTGADNISRFFASLDTQSLNYHVTTFDRESATGIEDAANVAIVNFNVSGEATVEQIGIVEVQVTNDSSALTLEGQVFTEEQRRRLSFAAREATGAGREYFDRLSVGEQNARHPGSDERVDALATIIARFKSGVNGKIQMRGSEVVVDATASSDELKSNIQNAATAARNTGLTVTDTIVVAKQTTGAEPDNSPSMLQLKLDQFTELVQETVVFNSGNAKLTEPAKFTLDQIASVLLAYPDIKVEVEGHTDNVGRDSVNEDLSWDRAGAVRQYLVSQSVDAARLVAVGFGSRQPLVSNDTSDGRKRNRRVHFTVPDTQ